MPPAAAVAQSLRHHHRKGGWQHRRIAEFFNVLLPCPVLPRGASIRIIRFPITPARRT